MMMILELMKFMIILAVTYGYEDDKDVSGCHDPSSNQVNLLSEKAQRQISQVSNMKYVSNGRGERSSVQHMKIPSSLGL